MFTAPASTHNWFKLWPLIGCMAAIFWLSVIKAPGLRFSDHWFWDNIDKFGHALAYAVLCTSGCWSCRSMSKEKKTSSVQILSISCFSFFYGLSIELLQHFLPHRSFDLFDILANAVGVSLGAVVFARFFR
jgi:VanZ family protein